MKKKVLMKRILTALAMAAMIPAGETWAAEITGSKDDGDYTVTVGKNDAFNTHVWGQGTGWLPEYWDGLKHGYPNDFDKVIFNDTEGLKLESLQHGKMARTDLDITVNSDESSDALQVTGNNNDFQIKDFTAHVSAPNSDALHISDGKNNNIQMNNFSADVQGADSDAISIDNTATNGTVTIHGTLDATVAKGNGIRANASFEEGTNKIIVQGETNITLEGGQVTYTETKKVWHILWENEYSVTSSYNPAAVYAGNDSTTGNITIVDKGDSFALGKLANGSGQVDLNGDATIQIGSNNYGLYAGKNGQINVGGDLDLKLTSAEAENAVGIAAENSTLIYKDKNTVKVDGKLIDGENITMTDDTSANHSGSSVILNGDANVINVGTNNKAIYAEGVDANGISNTVKSGDNGIGSFAITGNVEAENGGNITLDARNAESVNRLTGDLTADGVGSVYVAEDEVKSNLLLIYLRIIFCL